MTTARAPRPTWRVTLTDRGFVVHYLQMLAAMVVGMVVLMPVTMLLGDVGVEVGALLMATSMSIGMAAWMAWMARKRHSWASIAEMCLAMYLSFVVLFPAYWLGALSGEAVMIVGHVLMLPAMALAMLYRREDYVHC